MIVRRIAWSIVNLRGAISLRRGRHCFWPVAAILAGTAILLALVLPSTFWWFLLADGLIAAGIWMLRCC